MLILVELLIIISLFSFLTLTLPSRGLGFPTFFSLASLLPLLLLRLLFSLFLFLHFSFSPLSLLSLLLRLLPPLPPADSTLLLLLSLPCFFRPPCISQRKSFAPLCTTLTILPLSLPSKAFILPLRGATSLSFFNSILVQLLTPLLLCKASPPLSSDFLRPSKPVSSALKRGCFSPAKLLESLLFNRLDAIPPFAFGRVSRFPPCLFGLGFSCNFFSTHSLSLKCSCSLAVLVDSSETSLWWARFFRVSPFLLFFFFLKNCEFNTSYPSSKAP